MEIQHTNLQRLTQTNIRVLIHTNLQHLTQTNIRVLILTNNIMKVACTVQCMVTQHQIQPNPKEDSMEVEIMVNHHTLLIHNTPIHHRTIILPTDIPTLVVHNMALLHLLMFHLTILILEVLSTTALVLVSQPGAFLLCLIRCILLLILRILIHL